MSYLALTANSWLANSLFIYTAENFPTGRRSGASGTIQAITNLFAMAGPILFVGFQQQFGFFNAMVPISCFCFAIVLAILIFGNRTLGRSSEEIKRHS